MESWICGSSGCSPRTAGCRSPILGRANGLSTSGVHQRVKRLDQRGVIGGCVAQVDYDQLGLPLTAFVHGAGRMLRPDSSSQAIAQAATDILGDRLKAGAKQMAVAIGGYGGAAAAAAALAWAELPIRRTDQTMPRAMSVVRSTYR